MAFLKVIKGDFPSKGIEIAKERTVFGRHPSCEVALDNVAVSRQHAQILETHGSYYLEDLRSRNRTFLNGEVIEERSELVDGDVIRICNVEFSFHLQALPNTRVPRPSQAGATTAPGLDSRASRTTVPQGAPIFPAPPPSDEIATDTSSIIAAMDAKSSSLRLNVKPEAKLRAVLEISNSLARILSLDDVLQAALDGVFKMFPQADVGFALIKDPVKNKLIVKATTSRRKGGDTAAQVSMTVVQHAMETGEAISSADAGQDTRFNASESVAELKMRSMMCAPLLSKTGETLGVLQIDSRRYDQPFVRDDLEMMVSVASQASLAVQNAYLHEELLRKRDYERDLEFATQVQLGFLPNQRPKVDGFEFCDYYEAALRVGGDYFDYVKLPDDRIAIALADVAGKGIPAALLMARLYSSARFHLLTQPTIAKALGGLNAEITLGGVGHRFITFLFALIDARTRSVIIANAGHLPPVLRHGDGTVEVVALKESGMPLGVDPEQVFNEIALDFQPGDTLMLYTDGVTEAMDGNGDIYGRERLNDVISRGPADIDDLVKAIVSDVESYSVDSAQKDDICLVGLKRTH